MNIPDFTKVERQLLISASGLVFSIFALIYREEYVRVGLVTFAYGVIAWFVDTSVWHLFSKRTGRLWPLFAANVLLAICWLYIVLQVYPK